MSEWREAGRRRGPEKKSGLGRTHIQPLQPGERDSARIGESGKTGRRLGRSAHGSSGALSVTRVPSSCLVSDRPRGMVAVREE